MGQSVSKKDSRRGRAAPPPPPVVPIVPEYATPPHRTPVGEAAVGLTRVREEFGASVQRFGAKFDDETDDEYSRRRRLGGGGDLFKLIHDSLALIPNDEKALHGGNIFRDIAESLGIILTPEQAIAARKREAFVNFQLKFLEKELVKRDPGVILKWLAEGATQAGFADILKTYSSLSWKWRDHLIGQKP